MAKMNKSIDTSMGFTQNASTMGGFNPASLKQAQAPIQHAQLPNAGGLPDPTSYLEGTLQSQLEQINETYRQKWDMIQKSAKNMDPAQADAMLQDVLVKGQQEVAKARKDAIGRLDMIERITGLIQQGAITDGADAQRLLWETAGGKDIAGAMFPGVPEQPDPLSEHGKLSAHAGRLSRKLLDEYKVKDERVKQWYKPWFMEKKRKVVQKWVPELGKFVDAPNQVQAYEELVRDQEELALTRSAMEQLEQSPSMTNRILRAAGRHITGENDSGTYADTINSAILVRKATKQKLNEKRSTSKYKLGSTVTKNGVKYKVVAFDKDGEPLVDRVE